MHVKACVCVYVQQSFVLLTFTVALRNHIRLNTLQTADTVTIVANILRIICLVGGLEIYIPLIPGCFNLADLALCGILYLTGFYSKDLSLETVSLRNNNIFYAFSIFLIWFKSIYYPITDELNCGYLNKWYKRFIIYNNYWGKNIKLINISPTPWAQKIRTLKHVCLYAIIHHTRISNIIFVC